MALSGHRQARLACPLRSAKRTSPRPKLNAQIANKNCPTFLRWDNFRQKIECFQRAKVPVALLFGIGTKGPSIMGFEDEAEQSFGRPCRQSNGRNQADIRTHLIHRPARDILPPVDLRLPPDALILGALHAAAVSLVQWNSVPSIQMRCRITANRRAKATIAFFIPRRLAICMAQALSQDHFFERSMLCAAS